MLKTLQKYLYLFANLIAPKRVNSIIVEKINEVTINELPKAQNVDGMSWIYPLFHYKDLRVKAIIWELKYKENIIPLEYIGKIIFEEITALISDILIFNADASFLLIPIPLSVERKISRGYNQSEYIAKSILPYDTKHILLYAPQWFEKIKDTEIQSKSSSKQERMRNLLGCFEANPNVDGKYIILIDDVVTTGSTLSEARSTLLASGARDVFAFTIAH